MVNREPINCEQVRRELSDYLEGDVDSTLRASMDEHFRICKRCSSVLEGTRNVIQLYGDERMIDLPAGFSRRMEKRLAEAARSSGARWSVWSTWLIPVAALFLIAGAVRLANSVATPQPLKSEHAQPANHIPPDMKVVVTDDAKLFHVAGCEFIHNKEKEHTLTASEATREGYIPCARCMRKYLATTAVVFGEPEWQANASLEAAQEDTRRPGR